jgi:hypothetical protein
MPLRRTLMPEKRHSDLRSAICDLQSAIGNPQSAICNLPCSR